MNRLVKIVALGLVLLCAAEPALAQPAGPLTPALLGQVESLTIFAGAAVGSGLILLGAGFGIGRIGSSAVESMARQPQVAGNVQTAMLISAALIEGATFFGLIVCLISLFT